MSPFSSSVAAVLDTTSFEKRCCPGDGRHALGGGCLWFCYSIMNAVKVSFFRTPPAVLGFVSSSSPLSVCSCRESFSLVLDKVLVGCSHYRPSPLLCVRFPSTGCFHLGRRRVDLRAHLRRRELRAVPHRAGHPLHGGCHLPSCLPACPTPRTGFFGYRVASCRITSYTRGRQHVRLCFVLLTLVSTCTLFCPFGGRNWKGVSMLLQVQARFDREARRGLCCENPLTSAATSVALTSEPPPGISPSLYVPKVPPRSTLLTLARPYSLLFFWFVVVVVVVVVQKNTRFFGSAGERGPQHQREPVLLVYRGLPVAGREARGFRQRGGRHGHCPGAREARVAVGQDKDGEEEREPDPGLLLQEADIYICTHTEARGRDSQMVLRTWVWSSWLGCFKSGRTNESYWKIKSQRREPRVSFPPAQLLS